MNAKGFFYIFVALLLNSAMPLMAQKFDIEPATFEDLDLSPESYWRGDEADEDYYIGEFASGYFSFNNTFIADYDFWAFYAYANLTSNDYCSTADQFKTAPGGGHKSPNYCVAFVDEYMGINQIWVYGNDDGDQLKGCWITNSAWVKHCIYNGDGIEGPFQTGDFLSLTICGTDIEGEIISSKTIFLADFTDENPRNHFCLDTWEWVDLSDLGNVVGLHFKMNSSKKNAYGPTTPCYFCLDDLHTDKEISLIEHQYIPCNGFYNVAPHFNFDNAEADVRYFTQHPEASIDRNGNLSVIGEPNKQIEVEIGATQLGKTQYIKLPVTITEATGINRCNEYVFKVSTQNDAIKIDSDCDHYDITINYIDGHTILTKMDCNNNSIIPFPSKGIAIVLINVDGRTKSYKVIL